MNTRSGASCSSAWSVGPFSKPPSSAISRGLSPSRSSSAVVSGRSLLSGGLPGAVDAGRMNPRAPRRVFRRHLADLEDIPELVWLAELALADRASIRVEHRHQPVADRLAFDPELDLCGDSLGQVDRLLQSRDRCKLSLCAAAPRSPPRRER